jgi:predicted metal-dependent peptidase
MQTSSAGWVSTRRLLRCEADVQLDPQTAEAVSAALVRLRWRNAFFAALALFARFEASAKVKTAATDGRTIYVNPDFFGALNPEEQDGLLLHEVLHAALLHLPRRAGRDPKLWNIAADIVINGMILREGMALPAGGLVDKRREHLAVEEVYELLLREAKAQPEAGQAEDLLEGPPGDASAEASQPSDEATRRAAAEGHWQGALEQAKLVAGASVAGEIPAGMRRELGEALGPHIDWRRHLWRYLTQTPTDFQGFDRRFLGRGLYLETLAGESARVLLCVDTSGSIRQAALRAFVGEVQGILRAYPLLRCELYYADTRLHGPYPLGAGSAIPPPVGGGGTDFRPFFEAVERHSFAHDRTVAIYLTDGWGRFPSQPPRVPVLWAVMAGGRDLEGFPFGEVVRVLQP